MNWLTGGFWIGVDVPGHSMDEAIVVAVVSGLFVARVREIESRVW